MSYSVYMNIFGWKSCKNSFKQYVINAEKKLKKFYPEIPQSTHWDRNNERYNTV